MHKTILTSSFFAQNSRDKFLFDFYIHKFYRFVIGKIKQFQLIVIKASSLVDCKKLARARKNVRRQIDRFLIIRKNAFHRHFYVGAQNSKIFQIQNFRRKIFSS